MQAEHALVDAPRERIVRRIQPTSGLIFPNMGEIWHHKELLYYLLWRDIKARYKQTFLGAFWAIFRPLMSMIVMTVIFGHIAKIKPGEKVPYSLFLYSGILLWGYFASTVSGGAAAVISSGGLISKAYFPRVFAPIAAVTAPLVDFVLSLIVLGGLYVYYEFVPGWQLVLAPLFVLLALLTGLGVGFWLSPISVRYRDIGFALPFVVQIWMYATPIIYPVSLVPDRYRWI